MLFRACRSAPRLFRHLGLIATLATLLLTSLIPATTPAALAADPVLVGAGDIATCSGDDDEATAALLDTIDGTVFTTGDNAYNRGTDAEFANCYDPSWGRHKARTYPVPGNHDYATRGAAAYFAYFGERAGDPAKGYYSFNLDAWHVIALNSNCRDVGGCDAGSPQEQWLRADLAAHPAACTLAIWHHPRFSSGHYGDDDEMEPFWQALYDAGVELVINGHEHHYERFAPQDPQGNVDPNGVREFIAGTGGKELRPINSLAPNSEVQNTSTHGVLKLTLHPTSYDWDFVPVAGQSFRDSGTSTCVGASPGSGNLLRNGSFETDRRPIDNTPDSWKNVSTFTRSTTVSPQEGAYVGQFSDTRNRDYKIGQTVTKLAAGTTYTFSGWFNLPPQNDPNFACILQVRWQTTTNKHVSKEVAAIFTAPTDGWTRVSANLSIPDGATKARIQVVTQSLNGNIYLDDFVFQPESTPSP